MEITDKQLEEIIEILNEAISFCEVTNSLYLIKNIESSASLDAFQNYLEGKIKVKLFEVIDSLIDLKVESKKMNIISANTALSDYLKSDLCSRCQKNETIDMHVCPYRSDMEDDNETLCNCCNECSSECAFGI